MQPVYVARAYDQVCTAPVSEMLIRSVGCQGIRYQGSMLWMAFHIVTKSW